MTHAGQDVSVITLDLHPSTAAKTLLTAPEFVVEERLIDAKPGRKARNEGDECLPMGLPGGEVAKHELWILSDSRGIAESRHRSPEIRLPVTSPVVIRFEGGLVTRRGLDGAANGKGFGEKYAGRAD